MSQPLVELRQLLVGNQTVNGRVIAVANGRLRVATAGGVVEVAVMEGVTVGDAVTIRDGSLTKGGTNPNTPVYHV